MRTRPPRLLLGLLGLLGLAVVAGCTTTSDGNAEPAPTSDTTVETTRSTPPSSDTTEPDGDELPSDGAPKVEDPLDTSRFQQDPCQSLIATHAQELNVNSPGKPREAALGNACTWPSKSDRLAYVELAFLDKDPRGLSAVYKANKDGKWVFFDELDLIEGYPAVAYGGVDDRDNGKCAVDVGVSDEIAFNLVVRLSQANVGEKDPCETAAMVAGMALQTMKGDQ